ncbi:MAG: hypothetical protein IPN19_00255 [Elusimicrobia bacterium]|nr:hypothetical protein [Elusimicrobiota bacterium]
MKKEYDFSNATRGKFYRAGAKLRLPIYLEPRVHEHLEIIARRKHTQVSQTANQLLKKEIELIEQFA